MEVAGMTSSADGLSENDAAMMMEVASPMSTESNDDAGVEGGFSLEKYAVKSGQRPASRLMITKMVSPNNACCLILSGCAANGCISLGHWTDNMATLSIRLHFAGPRKLQILRGHQNDWPLPQMLQFRRRSQRFRKI